MAFGNKYLGLMTTLVAAALLPATLRRARRSFPNTGVGGVDITVALVSRNRTAWT